MLKINISARGKEHYAVFYPEEEFNEEGLHTIWHENGQRAKETNWNNGIRGKSTHWNDDGE
jgi:antitoxin component YwqK of YwqJK toxin-antitoxin module